ncbi:MAG: Rpn family recombination-promoting nuclease/putative transposase [Oculatellaceae cyanobacterium Prado106]|nr:Rpn family recombination-promoting nuclease/putative transposase [Oculatellaceae cyanobacterium Prado106]
MIQTPLLRLLRYGKPYQAQIWSAIACSILNTIFDLAPPYLIGIAIDVVVNQENSLIAQLGITSITGQLAVLSLLTLLIWSLESLTEYLYSRAGGIHRTHDRPDPYGWTGDARPFPIRLYNESTNESTLSSASPMVFSSPDRYVSLLTDFGFKRVFGTEPNKHLLIDFLNTLLPDYHQIRDLTFKNSENLGVTTIDRKAIFDIYCQAQNGDRFIVEIQKAKQNFFKDRSIYYASFPIQQQAEKGEWNYELTSVYTVGVLDFIFDDHKNEETLVHIVELKDQHCRVFYDKLKFIYIELPKFKKTVEQLETHFDKWLYLLRHLAQLDEPPPSLQGEEVFEDLFEVTEIANFSPDEQQGYQASLKALRDWYAIEMTARQEAKEEGREEERELSLQRQRSLTLRLLSKKLGELDESIPDRITALSIESLEALGEALLDFNSLADLEQWLGEQK